ncbi:MAG: TetR/AcrR family transcriptional regulator [Oscillospiraceae bacterium]|jgi:hypothetical protein|nr:TetR/AcrR family transcriptional regulator [Oscillospiraceae bacterium]
MAANTGKSDLRIVKTAKVLNAAMSALLARHNFRKITVWDICETAQVSRATFYARFDDKYDFLKNWLINFKPDGVHTDDAALNDFIYRNKAVIQNLVCDADNETAEILRGFVLSVFNITGIIDSGKTHPGQIVLSNFFAGGMLCYFQWQVKHKFPPHIPPINQHLREIITMFRKWETEANERTVYDEVCQPERADPVS